MRVVLAKTALDFLRNGLDPQRAANQAVALLAEKTGSAGGLILIDRRGEIGYARNSSHMPVCLITDDGSIRIDC